MRRKSKAPGVWVRCDACGRQRLPIEAMTLRTAANDATQDQVNWRCRDCGRLAVTTVRTKDAAALEAAGVQTLVWRRPGELTERPTRLPQITTDEVFAWMDLLNQPGWLEAQVENDLTP